MEFSLLLSRRVAKRKWSSSRVVRVNEDLGVGLDSEAFATLALTGSRGRPYRKVWSTEPWTTPFAYRSVDKLGM